VVAAALYPKVDRAVVSLVSKPDGVGAVSQRFTATGEQPGLLTHIAATESVWLWCARFSGKWFKNPAMS
jgi:hypothetical protein